MRIQIKIFIFFIIIFGLTPAAIADAIDGQWCFDNKSFSIDGSNFTTPGGKPITGDYDRHAYSYVVPEG